MNLHTTTVRQGINKAYLKVTIKRADLDHFKEEATAYLKSLSHAEGESEEHLKGYLRDFLQNSFYNKEERLVNTSNRVDLGIYSGKTKSSILEVLIEAKKPGNTREMITQENGNAKALHEALLYYFEEREGGNEDIKQVVITNYTEFFFFDAQEIERNFYSKKSLIKTFRNWKNDQKVSSNTDFLYGKFREFIAASDANLNGIYLNLKDYKAKLAAPASEDDDKKLIPLYKLFSPEHLVKKPFANDSNSLDKRFYNEFLHILGLQEVKEKGSRLIQRLPENERESGSLIENTIEILRYDQHMNEVRDARTQYGGDENDQLFGVALELVITWMNRILFLKLMEAQLLSYHNDDDKFKFLSFNTIDEYDELNKLFFRVLALRNEERPRSVQEQFGHIPYLNSSLFDSTKLEKTTIQISGLNDKASLGLYSQSILKKATRPPEGPLNTLDYLLRFLDAYNFSAESSGGIQTEDKTLINASVLGLIFEKINGYKDGSFFTPGFITEYMARETLRKAVIDKFAEALSPTPLPEGKGSDFERGMSSETPRAKLPESLLENARYLRKNQTPAEEMLWQLLRNKQMGLKFRRQHPIKEGFVIDFYCHEAKLAIELDGRYHNEEKQQISDQEREKILKEMNLQIVRFKNEEVQNNTVNVLETIQSYVSDKTHSQKLPSPSGSGVPEGRGEGELGEGDKLTLTDISNRIGRDISIRQANDIINSITICDPAVGSGHFLVSCLNELIAIKSELKILCDPEGKRIPYLDIEVENDELAIEHEGELFEYKLKHEWKDGKVTRKPAGSDRQRVQMALFHEKKFLIENCLFGVDINPNSVKICRLRLWIELLKHAYYRPGPHFDPHPQGERTGKEINTHSKTNEKDLPSPAGGREGGLGEGEYSELEVLPNIDINIKPGNSLVSRFGLDEDLSSIFKKSEHSLEDYKQAVRSYRETRVRNEKQRLEKLIDDIKAEYSESLLNNKPINKKLSNARGKLELMQNEDLFGEGKATKKELKKQQKKVARLEEEKAGEEAGAFYREAFEWRFEFPEVLDKDGTFVGFDVVIGNPPYVRQEALGDLKPFLKTHFDVYAGTADLYAYFIEQGVKLLRENGYFHYIVANKWMRANYGKPLRTWMQQRQITAITDFGDLPVFEEATTYPCLLEIRKTDHPTVFKAFEVESLPVENFEVLEEENGFEVDATKLSEEGWSLVPIETQRLLEKLKEAGTPLGEYVEGKIFYGIKTGLNKAFVIDEETKDRLIAEDASSAELIKPFLAGRDIKRYQVPEPENYLIFTRRGIEIDKYPAVKKYLEGFKEQLKPRPKDIPGSEWPGRKPGSYKWYEIQDAVDYYEEFEKPKIIYPNICKQPEYTYDDENKYTNQKCFIISLDDKFLLGYMNSTLVYFLYDLILPKLRGDYYEPSYVFLKDFPVPKKSEKLTTLVDEILITKKQNPEADTGKLEAEIDRLVYELYGLSEEEIEIVEGSVG
ncbi:type IIG restriction enzyme/methyltransferase [Rhodohalobacter sp. 614A]|uniref:type IIG restriction enzyme/methyltransferase n=1 Tax=Rhodohalobacter sp. 614A TaxID=2908649 RepID=UPI001F27D755|nr:DUF559 domain-containing protein [Rhodohalobacter sp. 614A]